MIKGKGVIFCTFLLTFGCKEKENVQPIKAEDQLTDVKDELPKIVINELVASNQTLKDEAGETDDWFEIYNAGTIAVNIGGMYVSDNKEYPKKYKIPETDSTQTTIQPGGHLLLWADSEMDQGILHVDFKLSIEGEDLGIYNADGKKIDEVSFGPQSANVSYGRSADGGANWTTFSTPTPGAPNN